MRESIALFNLAGVKAVLDSPTLEATKTFFKLNRIPWVEAELVTGKEEPGTVILVPGFSLDRKAYSMHAIVVSPRTEWYPETISDNSLVSFLAAYGKIRPSVTQADLSALKAEIISNRVETPRPFSCVTPGDVSLCVSEVVATVVKAKNGSIVAYEVVFAPSTSGSNLEKAKRQWILAVENGSWSAVKTDQDKLWKAGDVWKPVYSAPVSVSDEIKKIATPKPDTTNPGRDRVNPAGDDEFISEDFQEEPAKAYQLHQCLFAHELYPGKAWRLSKGKVVNIDLQFQLGPVGLDLLRKLYPKEISYALSHPYAGYFVDFYGHPSLRYLVNHLTVTCFSQIYRHQSCRETGQPALVADCGSKYHQLKNMLDPTEFIVHAYRPEIFPYDIAYNAERKSILPSQWRLYTHETQHAWNVNIKLPLGADLTAIDTIYYPGVRSGITAHLHANPKAVAHVVFTAYSQVPGHYSFVDKEGSYCVYEKPLKVPTISGKKSELWVLNMPAKNQSYEHPLFDYSPYSNGSVLDVNGIFWKEVSRYDIGNQAALVHVELQSVQQKMFIKEESKIGHENTDDMTHRYMLNDEYYGHALSFFTFKKLEKITPTDRKSALNYVLSKLQVFCVSEMQYETALRNVTYAAFDYIEKERNQTARIERATAELETTASRFLRERWARLKVELPSVHMTIEFQLFLYLVAWFAFHAVFPYFYASLVVGGLLFPLVVPAWCVPYFVHGMHALYPVFWLIYCCLYAAGGIVIVQIAWRVRNAYYETYTVHPSMARYVPFRDVVRGLLLKDLNEEQLADLQTPYNRSLSISIPLRKVLHLAHAVVTHFVVPKFVHSTFEFTSEFVRTTPSMMKKTVVNTLHALFVRQCGHYHRPEKRMLRKFLAFSQNLMDKELIPLFLTAPSAPYTIQQHLNEYEGLKRKDYERHWQDFNENFGIKLTAECMQKSNELSYLEAPKPRFLFNPSGSLKIIGTYINKYYLNALKNQVWLGVGYNTQQTAHLIERVYATIPDAIPVTWDGSNHDGHQYEELIEGIDGYFFRKTFPSVLPHLTSLPPGLYDQYLKILVSSSTKFYISYKRAGVFTRLIDGRIRGTTFSGHPTRTTLGNSLRVYLYARFVAARAQVKVGVIVAGDDVLCFVPRTGLERFRLSFWAVYIDGAVVKPKDRTCHGLGQVAKDYVERFDNTIDFLSKYGMIYHGRVIFNRRIERALLSGNDTMKVNKKFTIAHYNWSITAGLNSWARSWPVISKYVQARIASIPHWVPTSWQEKSKKFRQTLHEFFGYKFQTAVNHYDYRPFADAFHLMFNPYVIGLMEDDIRMAPQYLDMLYQRAPLKNHSFTVYNESKTTTNQKTKTTSSQSSRAKTRTQTKAAGAA